MEILRLLVLCLHFLGLAALVGVFLVQLRQRSGFNTKLLMAGAITQVVTGLLLVGLREAEDLPVNNAKVAVKLAIALVAAVCAVLADLRQRKDGNAMPFFHAAGGLGVVNVLVAVLW
ncbi:MAG: hypothetical protein AAGC63_09605 [Propionicimonas sp.]